MLYISDRPDHSSLLGRGHPPLCEAEELHLFDVFLTLRNHHEADFLSRVQVGHCSNHSSRSARGIRVLDGYHTFFLPGLSFVARSLPVPLESLKLWISISRSSMGTSLYSDHLAIASKRLESASNRILFVEQAG